MFDIWIPITVTAGFFQNLRSAIQKKLKDNLTTLGAAYSRFVYALPVALIYLLALMHFGSLPLPQPDSKFFWFCLAGGITQILFTVSLLWLFSFKSFAVGTTFSKLEVIMVAIMAAAIMGETISTWAVVAIAVSSLGVLALSMGQNSLTLSGLITGLFQKSTLVGLVCAALLGASSALYRGATQALGYEPFYANAAYTLVVSLAIQTVIMGVYMLWRERDGLISVFVNWRWASLAGIAGALASLCWFTAFTLQKAAYVRALGQSELIFTFIATLLFFKEKVSAMDYLGVSLVTLGILLLLILG